jgi:hypothetical protein
MPALKPDVDRGRRASPGKCGVDIPYYPISRSTDCDK